jgi:hypothetical protein
MRFFFAPEWSDMAVATVAAFILGWLLCWAMDKLFLKESVDDRIAGIALSCAVAFVVIMFWATVALTVLVRLNPYIVAGSIVVPPLPYVISLLVGLAAVGIVRTILYGRDYERGEEQLVFDEDLYDQAQYDEEVLDWDERHRHKNYLSRHWAGHLPLPVAFWINSVLVSVLVAAAVEYTNGRIRAHGGTLRGLAIIALVYFVFMVVFWVWSAVGIWRSAYWHRRRGGTPGWGLAARTLVVLSVLAILGRSGSIALGTAELGAIAAGGDRIGPVAEMKVSPDGRDLSVRGTLAAGASDRFAALIEANPAVRRILLSSPGGRMFEAERMADLIRQRRLDTRVEDNCESACTHLLIAGRERTAPEQARIGFNQPSFRGDDSWEREGVERARANFLAAGVKREFVDRALATPPESLWVPSPVELVEANVLTGSDAFVTVNGERRRENAVEMRLRLNIAATAERINASGPVRLDSDQTMVGVSASGSTLTYHYRVATDRVDVAGSRQRLGEQLRRQLCSDVDMAVAVREGARFVHSYSDLRGRHVMDVAITHCP